MAVKKRGDSYQSDFRQGGRRFRKDFPTAKLAEEWEQETLARLRAGMTAEAPSPASFASPTLEAVYEALRAAEWAGTKGERTAVRNAEDCLEVIGRKVPVDKVTTEDMDALVAKFRQQKLTTGTIRRKLAAVSRVLNYALERKWIKAVPFIPRKKLGKERERERYLSPAEEEAGVKYLEFVGKKSMAQFVPFGADTGLRLGEAMKLEWRHVQPDDAGQAHGIIVAVDTKNGETRSVPTTYRVRAMLAKRRSESPAGERRVWWDLTLDAAQYQWNLMREHLELGDDDEFVIHCLRHTFASRLVQQGVDLVTVAALGGWKTLSMVQRYAHLDQKAKSRAMKALEGRTA